MTGAVTKDARYRRCLVAALACGLCASHHACIVFSKYLLYELSLRCFSYPLSFPACSFITSSSSGEVSQESTINMTTPSVSPMDSVTSSSTQSTASRVASSTSSTHPNLARSSSYSHVFPSHQNLINPSNPIPNPNTPGLSKDTKALARRLLQNNPTVPSLQDERTVLFSSGL